MSRAFRPVIVLVLVLFASMTVHVQQPPVPPPSKPAQGHMDHRFDDPERYAKSFDDPQRDAWQMPARVIELLALKPNQSVADVGAGTGYFSMRLARAVPSGTVYAVDIEPAMVGYLRKRAETEHLKNVVTVQAGQASPNLPKPVDLVLIVDTYHHLPNRVAYFRDLRRSLQPGGRVAIIDFRKDSPEGPPVEFRFTAEQIEGELREAGYRVDARHDILPRQHFLVFRAGA
jgi:ubiquinone/menaquinone biosynthesis C-methylase UbiE